MSVFTIPYQVDDDHYNVMVVLADVNIARLKLRDPVELCTQALHETCGKPFAKLRLRDVVITYATVEEIKAVTVMLDAGEGHKALRLLTRGYKFRPEEGDDSPAVLLTTPHSVN
jgi:hypothetical protein